MRAVRIVDWGVPPELTEVPTPERGEGESLVRVDAAAVAHLDLTVASGDFPKRPELPYTGGVEGCGTIVESDTFASGVRVMLRGGGLGLFRDGTWAEYVTASDRRLVPVPAGLSPELGATYFVPTTTAQVVLDEVAMLGRWPIDPVVTDAADEVVLVGGATGAVGSMVTQLALRSGARVLGVVADDEQAERLPSGAEPIRLDDPAVTARLATERPGTVLVDTLGGPGLAERAAWIRAGGRVCVIGYVAGTELSLDLPSWLLNEVALLPVNMIRRDRAARERAAPLAELLIAGELRLDVQTFPLAEAGRALSLLKSGGLRGRAVLVPDTGDLTDRAS